jgi:hypothetical protein
MVNGLAAIEAFGSQTGRDCANLRKWEMDLAQS